MCFQGGGWGRRGFSSGRRFRALLTSARGTAPAGPPQTRAAAHRDGGAADKILCVEFVSGSGPAAWSNSGECATKRMCGWKVEAERPQKEGGTKQAMYGGGRMKSSAAPRAGVTTTGAGCVRLGNRLPSARPKKRQGLDTPQGAGEGRGKGGRQKRAQQKRQSGKLPASCRVMYMRIYVCACVCSRACVSGCMCACNTRLVAVTV